MIILKPKAKPWVEEKIQTELKKSCDTCEFSLGDVFFSWRGFAIENVHFKSRPSGQRLECDIYSLFIYPRLDSLLLDGEVQLRTVILDQPKLSYFDDANDPAPKTSSDALGLPANVGIRVENGDFTYVRDVRGTHAVLKVRNIQAKLATEQETIYGQATARIGDQGLLQLNFTANPTNKPPKAEIELTGKNQNMAALSEFFEPNAGVKMEGTMMAGNVVSKLSGPHVSTDLTMEFKDFKLKVNSMYDRSDIQAFFTNIAAAAALRKENTDAHDKAKTANIETDRGGDETAVSFILRSWKEAALKVAQ